MENMVGTTQLKVVWVLYSSRSFRITESLLQKDVSLLRLSPFSSRWPRRGPIEAPISCLVARSPLYDPINGRRRFVQLIERHKPVYDCPTLYCGVSHSLTAPAAVVTQRPNPLTTFLLAVAFYPLLSLSHSADNLTPMKIWRENWLTFSQRSVHCGPFHGA